MNLKYSVVPSPSESAGVVRTGFIAGSLLIPEFQRKHLKGNRLTVRTFNGGSSSDLLSVACSSHSATCTLRRRARISITAHRTKTQILLPSLVSFPCCSNFYPTANRQNRKEKTISTLNVAVAALDAAHSIIWLTPCTCKLTRGRRGMKKCNGRHRSL